MSPLAGGSLWDPHYLPSVSHRCGASRGPCLALVGIHSRPQAPERRQLIRRTWLDPSWQALGIDFIFILSNPKYDAEVTEKLLNESQQFQDIAVVPGGENKPQNFNFVSGDKTWGFFRWAGMALGPTRYKFVLKVCLWMHRKQWARTLKYYM